MANTIRWGILGTGSIAHSFATGLKAVGDAKLMAVGSRTQKTADRFADEFDVPHRHAGYENLAADDEVDAIYVSTPHPFHADNTLLCLEAGKAVLCEKPFAMNAAQAESMIRTARQKKIFLMEAMWTRFTPAMARVREWLASGAIGEVQMVTADFGFRAGLDPKSRLFNPELGGGALLDVGVYTLSFASMVMGGPPEQIASLADMGSTGVDEQNAMVLGYGGGRMAVLSSAVRTNTRHEACVIGTDGRIEVPPLFWQPRKAVLHAGPKPTEFESPFVGNGYNYEAEEVGRCLREGRLESEIMPLDETLSIMKTMDRIRGQWGLTYPME